MAQGFLIPELPELMETAVFNDELSRERRARLAAERLLEQKQAELKNANRKLSQHALSLSDQIVDQRKVLAELEGHRTAGFMKTSKRPMSK